MRNESDSKPPTARAGVAFITNSQTPYRLALHQRIVNELPEIRLWSLYTHETSNANWKFVAPPAINPVLFGKGENCLDATKPKNLLKEYRRAAEIIQWMKEHDIKAVVVFGYNDIGRVRIMRWCHRSGIPCLMFGDSNIHGDTATGIKAVVKSVFVRYIVRLLSGLLVCGTLGREYFVKYGAKTKDCFYFPYEPDYKLIESLSTEQIQTVRERFNLNPSRRRLAYSGRLVDVKRVDLLVDAFVKIAPQRPDWDLLVIGDGPMKPQLLERIPEALVSRVIWAGFIDDQATVSALYRNCDTLVLPSDFEPWALVINEAAAAGLSIISTNVVGAAAELVRDGKNGRLFPPGDLPALCQAILEVTDPVAVDAMKTASKAVLSDWRQRGDPVAGLRSALQSVALVPAQLLPD